MWNEFHCWLRIQGTQFIAGWAYEDMISSLAEHTWKCLKVEYFGRIENNFQKSRVTGPWDHKVSVSAKKSKNKFHACVPLISSKISRKRLLKGHCHEIFCFGFFLDPVSPKSLIILLGPFRTFSKFRGDICSSRFATGVNDTGGKWKKSSSRKILIILFGHLWVVELTYIFLYCFIHLKQD